MPHLAMTASKVDHRAGLIAPRLLDSATSLPYRWQVPLREDSTQLCGHSNAESGRGCARVHAKYKSHTDRTLARRSWLPADLRGLEPLELHLGVGRELS
jgi:hypothetical protein